MSSYDIIQSNFQAGELSPLFSGRSTSNLYAYGMKKAQNVLPMKAGGARRRPGTTWMKIDGTSLAFTTIIPIVCNGSEYYVLFYADIQIKICTYDSISETFTSVQTLDCFSNYIADNYSYTVINETVYYITNGKKLRAIKRNSDGVWSVQDAVLTGIVNNGFRAISSMSGRLILQDGRDSIVLSKAPDYALDNPYRETDFTLGSDSDSAIAVTNELIGERCRFLVNAKLIIVSNKGILSSSSALIDATSFYLQKISDLPCSTEIQPISYGGSFLVVDENKKNIQMLYFSNDYQSYSSRDITEIAQHYFARYGIYSIALSHMGEDILWVASEEGMLSCSLSQSSETNIYGWSRHSIDGFTIRSVFVCEGLANSVMVNLRPKLESVTYANMPIAKLDMSDIFFGSTPYLDMRYSYVGAETTTVQYIKRISPQKIDAYINSKWYLDLPIDSNGVVTLPISTRRAIIGIRYQSVFGFLSKEIPSNGDSSIYNKRRLKKATVSVYQSQGGKIGLQYADESKMLKMLTSKYGELKYGEQPHIVDEILEMEINSPNVRSAELYITTEEPTPLNILSVKEKIEILET